MDLVWFIDAVLTINMINMNMYVLIYTNRTYPDEVFVIVISYKVNNNNKIKSLDFRF